jgi:uncharacterized surface protein with fasciclin (FAS1) repeats
MKLKNMVVATLVGVTSFVSFALAEKPATVVDIAVSSDVHTTLVAAVVAADLAETLSSEGPFTVFAPTNSAFAMLPTWAVQTLLEPENIEKLRSILTYHVISGKVLSTDLTQWLTVNTVEWNSVSFSHRDNAWYIDTAKIIATDIMAGNGVVHVIDGVIMPPENDAATTDMMMNADLKNILSQIYDIRSNMAESTEDIVDAILEKYWMRIENLSANQKDVMNMKFSLSLEKYIEKFQSNARIVNALSLIKYEIMIRNYATNDVVDVAILSDVHTTLVTAVSEAGLVPTLQSDGPFTVFAPVDAAFEKLPEGTVLTLLAEEDKSTLTDILTYHVVPWAYLASDIYDGLMLETVNGESLHFTINDTEVRINDLPTLLSTDIVTSNGVIHVIDDVLMPNK